jgi:hypothetical protein
MHGATSNRAEDTLNRIHSGIRWQERLSARVRSRSRRIREKPWSALGGGASYLETVRVGLDDELSYLATDYEPGLPSSP